METELDLNLIKRLIEEISIDLLINIRRDGIRKVELEESSLLDLAERWENLFAS